MSDNSYSFSLKVDDIFAIVGKGTVVSGKITLGVVKLGDSVSIIGGHDSVNARVTGIESFNKLLSEAKSGESVGLVLEKIDKKAVKKGWLIVKYPDEGQMLENPVSLTEQQRLAQEAREQMESAGLKFYVWSTCGDERVRPSHALMEGKLCRWSAPEVCSDDGGRTWKGRPKGAPRYHPGEDEECRCTALSYEPEITGEI